MKVNLKIKLANLTSGSNLLATIGAIAALSLWLRQAVIDFMITGGKKKRSFDFLIEGKKNPNIKSFSLSHGLPQINWF